MRPLVCALGAALALGACGDRPRPAAPEPPPAHAGAAPRPVASFEATIVPPTRGPGMGQVPGEAVFTVLPEGRDGHAGTNPARTIELVGDAFTWQAEVPGCGSPAISSPVRITNYLPERLVDLHVAFTVNDSEHQLCTSDPQPVGADYIGTSGSGSVYFDAPPAGAGPSGYLDYVVPDQFPRNALAGSPVDDGSAPGGSATVEWQFAYPVLEAPPFTLRGNVWAELYPARPVPYAARTWSALELGMGFRWLVEDQKDRWPTLNGVRVSHADARVCSVPFDGAGECPASGGWPLQASPWPVEGPYIPSSQSFAYVNWFDAALPPQVVAGQTYHLRVVNVWDSDANAATPMVKGSLALERTFVAVGAPTPTADSGAGRFTWTVDHPVVTAPDAGRPVLRICATWSCDPFYNAQPVFEAGTGWSAVESPPGSGTYLFTVAPAAVEAALRAYSASPGNYYWIVRNLHADEAGPWSQPRTFYYSPSYPWTP